MVNLQNVHMEGGETSIQGASGFTFSSSKDTVKPLYSNTNFQTELKLDADNEVKPLTGVDISKEVHLQGSAQPVIVKEVSNVRKTGTEVNKPTNILQDFQNLLNFLLSVKITADHKQRLRQKPQHNIDNVSAQVYVPSNIKIVEKEIIHTHRKPHRHHFRKTAFLGGYIGDQGNIVAPAPAVVYKTVEPTIQKRIDGGAEAVAHAGAGVAAEGSLNGRVGGDHFYRKEVSIQKSPTFFADIFNIPISALKAVGDFLGNTAANTNISVQKSASVQAESDGISLNHDPLSSSSSASSASHIKVETPSASKIIDDIFSIPINTLGAVNKFLENNVAARKNAQVAEDGTVERRARLGPHARRRANKQVLIVQQGPTPETKTE